MKARIVELEGTAQEIADVFAATTTARTPQLDAPEPQAGSEAEDVVDVIDEPAPSFGVTRADRAASNRDPEREASVREHLAGALLEAAGEEPPHASYSPVPKWQSVPLEQRRWSSNKNTLHLRDPDDPSAVRCGSSKLAPEDAVLEYPQAATLGKVCGTCWRRVVEAGRNA